MSTNVLTANQADGTDTSSDTTGLVTTGAGSTVTSSTTQKYSGSRSIECVCAGSGTGEGVKTTTTAVTLPDGAVTWSVKVYPTVEVDVTVALTSSSASFAGSITVADVPADEWTTITAWDVTDETATDGVLTVETAETLEVDLYVDELGVWPGILGEYATAGGVILNTDIVGAGTTKNSNQVNYYAGLAPISATQEAAIEAGTSDALMDWAP